MRSNLLRLVLLLIFIFAAARYILPGVVEDSLNKVAQDPPYAFDTETEAIHQRIPFIADWHSDALLWARDLNERSGHGHVDVPRLVQANVALQVFTIVSKTPKGQNYDSNTSETDNITALMMAQGRRPATWTSLMARGLDMCERMRSFAQRNKAFSLIRTSEEFEAYLMSRVRMKDQTSGILGVEGLHVLEGKRENLKELFDAGVRMVAPVHFFDNELGGSAHGVTKGGLTPFGKTVLAEAEALDMIIDLSHGSSALIADILEIATKPIVVSHTGVQAVCPGDRNLTDEQLLRIAENGGLVGVAMFKQAVCSEDISGTVRTIRHLVDLIGIKHVALGSDFDGAVTTPFDVTGLPYLTKALLDAGFSESDITAIMGGNSRDFLLKNLPRS